MNKKLHLNKYSYQKNIIYLCYIIFFLDQKGESGEFLN